MAFLALLPGCGRDTLTFVAGGRADLILSDVRLKGRRTGVDLARAAKKKGVPVLFASGHAPPEEAPEISLGCLMKPYNERQLRLALESVDRFLAGKKVKPPKGLHFFAIEQG